jgi:hypothetical protein
LNKIEWNITIVLKLKNILKNYWQVSQKSGYLYHKKTNEY